MPVKGDSGCGPHLKRCPPANFKVFPPSLPGQLGQLLHDERPAALTKLERSAKIAERETNTPAARQRTPHVHHWDECHRFAALRTAHIDRLMAIGLAQYLGPSGGVKKVVVGM